MKEDKQSHALGIRLYAGLALLIIGFFSPLLSFYIESLQLPVGVKALLIGGLVFGIPEILILAAIAIMGKEAWDLLKNKLIGILTFIYPQKVSKGRYYAGVSLFAFCLIEGILEIHTDVIQHFVGDHLGLYQWGMNGLFILSFFIAGGDFWDKCRSLFLYTS